MEMSGPDPVKNWTSSGDQTGLEEPMWQLGLGDASESYPERSDEADCIYYLRTGFCGYGSRCRFNHPRDRGSVIGALRGSGEEYPERIGQPVCQYYMRTGMCKFGVSCKYHHPRQGIGSPTIVPLNVSGYPLRPGEKECSYYVKTGQCKFGATCKFHHPQPAGMVPSPPPAVVPAGQLSPMASTIYPNVQSPAVVSSQPYGMLATNWPVARPPLLPGSYLPGTYGPVLVNPGMVPFPGWNPYQAPPNTQPILGGPAYAMSQLSSSYPLTKSQTEDMFPQSPGDPECQFYMRTGDCKFGSSCRYHHPPPNTNFGLSPMGLPIRPGAPLCSHYAQNGVCKFGPSCKYDHPMGTRSYSPSASSLADMPVAPYPVGSYMGTLAPSSSSSSDLRPETTSGPTIDHQSTASFSKSVQISQSSGSTSSTKN